MAAIVERDDAAAVLLQVGDPGRIDPVHVLAGGKAMHENDRIALAFVEIGYFDSAVVETRHHGFRFSAIRIGDLWMVGGLATEILGLAILGLGGNTCQRRV